MSDLVEILQPSTGPAARRTSPLVRARCTNCGNVYDTRTPAAQLRQYKFCLKCRPRGGNKHACSGCGQPGHDIRTCPNEAPALPRAVGDDRG